MSMKIAGRLLAADAGDRVLRYLLLPFGEPGRTNKGRLLASAPSVTIPEDVTRLTVNVQHDPTQPVGKFESVERTERGLEASVRVLATRAGDDYLVEAREGVRTGISVELDGPGGPGTPPVIRNGKLLASVLAGAGVCVDPAFPSAQLVAADAGDLPEDFPEWQLPSESTSESTEELVINGVTYVVKRTTTSKTEVDPKNGETPTNDDDADPSAESETEMGTSLTATSAAASGMQLHAGAPTPEADLTARQAFQLLASAFRSGNNTQLQAALANVVHDDGDNDGDGLGEITAAPGWLGQVWDDAAYERIFIPLIANGTLTSYREIGWQLGTKPKVAKYAGNKAEVPTGGMTATPVNYLVERWAHAADIDRRYIDFGDSDVLRAFTDAQVESYKEETDLDVAASILANATTTALGTLPTGVNEALGAIVRGAFNLITKRLKPDFAIVGADLYEPILFIVEDDLPAFLSKSFGLNSGVFEDLKITPTALPAYAGQVVVGDGRTQRFKELGGTPVRVEAEHVANGGKDFGVFGYTSYQVLKPGGIVRYDLSGA